MIALLLFLRMKSEVMKKPVLYKADQGLSSELIDYQKEIQLVIDSIAQLKAKHPELLKYLDENHVADETDLTPDIRLRDLREYFQSIQDLSRKYEI